MSTSQRNNKRRVRDYEDEKVTKRRLDDTTDTNNVGTSTPPSLRAGFSPLHTPSAVTNNDSYVNFSSENTLSMHTSVESSAKAISRIASMKSDESISPKEDPKVAINKEGEPLARKSGVSRRSRLSSIDLVDALEDDNNVNSPPESPLKNNIKNEDKKRPFDMSLGIAVSLAYASFIFCRSFFAVTQAAMKADPVIALTDAQANTIITSFGVAFGVAKFPSGILVNSSPPKAALLIFMVLTSAAVLLASHPWTDNYTKIMVIALLNAIPQAGAYPAVTKLVCAGFEPSAHSSVFALISIGSRVGQVAVSLVLGEVLRRSGDWRVAIRVAPLVVTGAMVLVIVLTHGKTNIPMPQNEEKKDAPQVDAPLSVRLSKLLKNPRFWLVNSSASMLLISKAFDTYAVRYITDICNYAHPVPCLEACTCKSYAAQITAGVSLGIVTSLLFGSWVYERLKGNASTRFRRACFIVGLCVSNFIIALALYVYTLKTYASPSESYTDATDLDAENRQLQTLILIGGLLFLLGFSSGYPFYVPQSLFAVEDASDAATVVGCGECVQSVLGAAVLLTAQHYAIGEDGGTNWITIWGAIVTAAGSGFILMAAFMYASIRSSKLKSA